MAGSSAERRSAAAWRLVRSQHGVVTREQLLALGFTKSALEHRLQTGRLHVVARGVYAVGRAQVDREGRWMAAVLVCGPDAALSHRSAAALWGFAKEHSTYIDVSVRRRSETRLPGLRCHRRPTLAASEITRRRNIPLTQPVQTFLDLVSGMGPRDLERAINEADKVDVIDADALRKALDERPGEMGVRPLRRILDKHTFRLSDDELERLFRPLAAAAGLPVPLTKHMVNKIRGRLLLAGLGAGR